VTTTAADASADAACHDLLVRLAGRLPDRLLWRLREWLATGAHASVAATLPRALLRHRVGLTDGERDLLDAAVAGHGASARVLDAILTLTDSDEPDPRFRPDPDLDTAALSLLAVARGDSGCVEVRQAVRTGGRRPQRVVLVRAAGARPWALVATLGRLLRAHGDPTPCVEVLPAGEPPAYHRAALAGSAQLWCRPGTAPAVPSGG
jgi:hypothetical protein